MFPTDHFFGQFQFETETGTDDKGCYARAQGFEARHPFSTDQALNDLNQVLDNAIATGKLVPDMGNG
jgi:hypothetical protein